MNLKSCFGNRTRLDHDTELEEFRIRSRKYLEWIFIHLLLLNDMVFLSCGAHVRNIKENIAFDSQPSPLMALNDVWQLPPPWPLSGIEIRFLH